MNLTCCCKVPAMDGIMLSSVWLTHALNISHLSQINRHFTRVWQQRAQVAIYSQYTCFYGQCYFYVHADTMIHSRSTCILIQKCTWITTLEHRLYLNVIYYQEFSQIRVNDNCRGIKVNKFRVLGGFWVHFWINDPRTLHDLCAGDSWYNIDRAYTTIYSRNMSLYINGLLSTIHCRVSE